MTVIAPGGHAVIAIDGTAASGKGTLARRLAEAYGFDHLDTGLLYRAVGLAVLRAGGDPEDPIAGLAAVLALDLGALGDQDLRGDAAAQAASRVSAIPGVRTALLDFQRAFAGRKPGAVLDGRDIGTVICPDAPAKVFVTATLETRAERRWKELLQRGHEAIYSEVFDDLRQRDERDRRRAVAPLVPASDAFLLDTSQLTADQVFDQALAFVSRRIGPPRTAA
jgi:cytidylate kinase